MLPGSRRQRGFTLAELMIVVAIVGVLATVAIASLRKFVFGSKIVEATSMLQSIRVAQESWKGAHASYFNVSGTLTTYYPTSNPGMDKRSFWLGTNDPLETRWRLLNPTIPGPVRFGYAVVAGNPDSAATPVAMPATNLPDPPTWDPPADHWYVIQAIGDADGDGVDTVCATASISNDVVCQDP